MVEDLRWEAGLVPAEVREVSRRSVHPYSRTRQPALEEKLNKLSWLNDNRLRHRLLLAPDRISHQLHLVSGPEQAAGNVHVGETTPTGHADSRTLSLADGVNYDIEKVMVGDFHGDLLQRPWRHHGLSLAGASDQQNSSQHRRKQCGESHRL